MKQLLLGLVAVFAFGTAFAQSATPVAASTTAPVATDAPADEDDDNQAAAVPAGAEEVFVAPAGAQVPATPVARVAPVATEIPHALLGLGAAAVVAVAVAAGGSDDDDDKPGECTKPRDDCPSSP